jgi:glycosyltransferase involved in cell wall biosynthesis
VKVIALIEVADHVCARYRIAAFAPALEQAGWSITLSAIPRGRLSRLLVFSRLRGFDAVILQRRLMPAYQLKLLRRNARRLIFDFDDAVFGRDSYHPEGIICPQRERQFQMIISVADEIIAGNGFLGEQAVVGGATPHKVHVIPTCVDPARYMLAPHRAKQNLDLVWIGSSSTLKGLEQRRELFEQLEKRFSTMRLRVICDRFPNFANPPIVPIQWSQESEAVELATSDIGINLVPDDRWSRGKCGLKILQYYAAGLPVIANSVGVHTEMIKTGVTGILADTSEQWIDAIRTLSDPATRRFMGEAARALVEQRYAVTIHRDRFVKIVTRI